MFQGKQTVSELMDGVNIKLCAPMNTPSNMNRPHNVRRSDGFKKTADGGERVTVPRNTVQEHMFDAYINNACIDTFDFLLVNIDDSIYNPIKEYLMNIPTGWLGASLIGQTFNPHVLQNVQNSYNPDFEW